MRIIRADADRFGELHALLASALRFDRFSAELLREKLFESPQPGIDEYAVWIACEHDQLLGLMQSVVRTPAAKAWLGLFAVAERRRRRGVATALFEHVRDSWRAAGIREAEVLAIPGNYLTPGLDPRYTAALCFIERVGFERFKDCVNLIADLRAPARRPPAATEPVPLDPFDTSADEQRLATRGIAVRRAAPGDTGLLDAFFSRHFGEGWRLEVERARRVSPPALHLALVEGQIAGFAAHSGMNREWGFFGPMGTAPAAEGQGIGRVLLRRCLVDLRRDGHTLAVIPWVGPIGFYARHVPCRVHRVFWRYRMTFDSPA